MRSKKVPVHQTLFEVSVYGYFFKFPNSSLYSKRRHGYLCIRSSNVTPLKANPFPYLASIFFSIHHLITYKKATHNSPSNTMEPQVCQADRRPGSSRASTPD